MKLIVVPTPIGNLDDISLRAIDVLKTSDLILCEDTRQTLKLLNHFDIKKSLQSYHAHNEHQILERVLELIKTNEQVALVSDAGMPGISDPGYLLIRECVQQGIPLEVLPGPTAAVTAVVASGIPCDRYYFQGFLPIKKGRKSRLEWLAALEETVIIYESPHKIIKTLMQLIDHFGAERQACLAREISKIHEEYIRGTLNEIHQEISSRSKPKGEIVLILSGK